MAFANTNPFKRVGSNAHRTPPPAAPMMPPLPTTTTTHTQLANQTQLFISQPQPINPVQHALPLQSVANRQAAPYPPQTTSIHSTAAATNSNFPFNYQMPVYASEPIAETTHTKLFQQPDNLELAPHNDRNEYLQTGHLFEDSNIAVSDQATAAAFFGNNDHLPPPGLSRLVLGEPELFQPTVPTQDSINHPMPVLDRMIPGTDLNYPANLNLERQADGQDTDESSAPIWSAPTMSTHPPPENQVYIPTGSENTNDRNLYLVAGESTEDNIQRVVTGVENVENQEVPIVEQQRELEMDGENVDDNFQPNRVVNIPASTVREREEPIEGANTMTEIVQVAAAQAPPPPPPVASVSTNLTVLQSDSVEYLDSGTNYNQKYNSNGNSTGNDDSDKEKSYNNNRKGANSRRSEERTKNRGPDEKHDKHQNKRYETEDTDHSVRGNRRRNRDKYDKVNDGGYDSSKERNENRRGGGSKEKSDRSYRDRPSGRDKHYRDSSRDDEDRYDTRYRGDRSVRHETDSSRYGPDDPRYDRNGRRRNDRDRDYGRNYRDDRQYRKDRERDDRDGRVHSDERYRNRDDRYSEYESNEYGSKSRGGQSAKPRDRKRDRGNGSERGDNYSTAGGSSYYHPTQHTAYGAYDPYSSYYQQQQYYENLRRTNPHAYAEWYNRYFGNQLQMAAANAERGRESGRESVHSGRSSSKDNERFILPTSHSFYNSFNVNQQPHHVQAHFSQRSMQFSAQHNSTMLDGINGTMHNPPTGSRPTSAFSHTRMSRTPYDSLADQSQNQPTEPERLTPFKYTSNHCSVSFDKGVLVCVKQKYLPNNDVINNVNVIKFAQNNGTRRLYQMFPGPLTPATHTKQVIDFCLEQLRSGPNGIGNSRSTSNSLSSLQSIDQSNRASFALLWNFLILLLRQRGVFVGSDIAELLLKNKEQYPYEQHQLNSSKYSQKDSGQSSESDGKDEASNDIDSNDSEHQQLSSSAAAGSATLTETEITEKFRNYLLYGSITEALDWATDNNLWGHALFLASKMDRRAHANVMIKFANKLSLTDPLQTLYQLKSGRIPHSVTCTQDEKWGDWRPHLAMIISNPTQKVELDRKAIITMGDSLHNRGDLFAAQFCYLMAKVGFGRYSDVKPDTSIIVNNAANAVRLILLGASCHKNFGDFASDEAIIMTEIYEYACTLSTDNYSIVEFQPYKFLLGTRMLDYGFHLKSLMYMEQVAAHIQKNPTRYERNFVERVFAMADQLKYYDPVLEKNLDNINDDDVSLSPVAGQQQWQQNLLNLLNQLPTDSDVSAQQATISNDPYAPADASANQIDKEFMHINQQFSDLNLQYQQPTSLPHQSVSAHDYANNNNYGSGPQSGPDFYSLQNNNYVEADTVTDAYQQQSHDQQHQHQQQQQQQQQYLNYYQSTNPNDISHYDDHQSQGYQAQPVDSSNSLSYGDANYLNSEPEPEHVPLASSTNTKIRETPDTNVHESMHPHSRSQNVPKRKSRENSESNRYQDDDLKMSHHHHHHHHLPNPYDKDVPIKNKLSNVDDTLVDNPAPKPQISMPNSYANKPGFYEEPHADQSNDSKGTDDKNSRADGKKKAAQQLAGGDSKGSGWIGGLFNKFSLKPKNQMILPDDKNPSIVWDPEKKKWTNTEGEESEETAFKPPPKMPGFASYQFSNAMPNIPSPTAGPMQSNEMAPPVSALPPVPEPNNNAIGNVPTYGNAVPQLNNIAAAPTPAGPAPSLQPNATPSLQSNMFKMQRNKKLKNSYVDVFNPSKAPAKAEPVLLAETIPSMPAQGNFFVPSPMPVSNEASNDEPMFYNPNQFGSYQQQ